MENKTRVWRTTKPLHLHLHRCRRRGRRGRREFAVPSRRYHLQFLPPLSLRAVDRVLKLCPGPSPPHPCPRYPPPRVCQNVRRNNQNPRSRRRYLRALQILRPCRTPLRVPCWTLQHRDEPPHEPAGNELRLQAQQSPFPGPLGEAQPYRCPQHPHPKDVRG